MLPCCQRHLHYSFSNAATWFVLGTLHYSGVYVTLELFILVLYAHWLPTIWSFLLLVFRNGQLCEGIIFLDEIGNIYSINNGINETSNVRCMYENMERK